jgi:phosphoenolpyruvate synthase/pyruvate phosphate dikinase
VYEFAKVFDDFSIANNELVQLTLGIERDSRINSNLFDKNNAFVNYMIEKVIQTAKRLIP